MASRRPTSSSATTQAEIALLPSLKSCLVNLPSSLVQVLLNSNTVAQNVVVELVWRQPLPSSNGPTDSKQKQASVQKSVYVGWTGMGSQTQRDGIRGVSGVGRGDREVEVVEVDATFARLVGLERGAKVSITLHLDPPQAHTINIEPLTPTDWEIIELHAHFLEMNFLSQIRALPNPSTTTSTHPLTLHLTPTSTANVIVTSLTPAPAVGQAFVKISPDAEVIVAPKTRQSQRSDSNARDGRSVASTGRRSEGGRSHRSTATDSGGRRKSVHDEEKARPPIFLRAVTRGLENEWFEDGGEGMKDEGLKVWVDHEHLLSKTLRGVSWATISVLRPAGLQEPPDPSQPQQQQSQEGLPATKVVAKICPWDDAPDSRHAALSSLLCSVLSAEGIVGGIVRIDPAPSPLPKTASALKGTSDQLAGKENIVKRLRITPFIPPSNTAKATAGSLRFGGESKAEKDEAVLRLKAILGRTLLEGPLTNGILIPSSLGPDRGWHGGILDFDPSPPGSTDSAKPKTQWLLGGDRKLEMTLQQEIPRPKIPALVPGEVLPREKVEMVGIESVIESTKRSLLHGSSVLLTGGLGSGKTSLAQLLAQELKEEWLFQTIFFPCRTLITDETRVKPIKETLNRVFLSAQWGARLGGRSLVILDDLDKLCPVETELQVDANGQSKQVSELLCTIARQFCGRGSGVVLLATAQGKEAVNNVVVGGHVVRDIVGLKAPGKEGRRKVLERLARFSAGEVREKGVERAGGAWMDGGSESEGSRPVSANGPSVDMEGGMAVDPDLDLLEIAGQTDGYMPGDLTLLVSRARSEALIRSLSSSSTTDTITLSAEDFTSALKGFTPASLRGVTLHSGTTTFSSIGGLKETRQTLLETLQYPTIYAPLFSRCPLRLRSGLLLYGYPGCGKTLLASAISGECGLNFISVKGPEILNKYIGASEKSVRDLFERAEAAKPCVLFFDEFDSIAPKRGHDSTGVTDRVVNMLLTMMDGAEGLSGVYVLAATSRPDMIDPALLRPGRLDKSLICDMPNHEDRWDILRAVSKKLRVEGNVFEGEGPRTLEEVAHRTEGYSGADLQAVMYNAHLEAIHDVLGNASDAAAQDFGKRKTGNGVGGKGGKGQEFTYFRYGNQDDAGLTPAAAAAERADIAAKLSALQLARRKAKAERHATLPGRPTFSSNYGNAPGHINGTFSEEINKSAEPIISWHHLEKSLSQTRASISAQERKRLAAIYAEFTEGRNGQMSDGQGGTEVGGRSSLA